MWACNPMCVPAGFPAPSPWTDAFGDYCNGEPGRPLLVSLLLYLDAGWPRDWAAETLFLDDGTNCGVAVRPRPYRAVLMDQVFFCAAWLLSAIRVLASA